MGLNSTPSAERLHIGIFGRRNAGKSSLFNALTGQEMAVVSETAGTTTDPVVKAMELLPLGPVVLMDTPGLDDEGGLGSLRVKKSYQMLFKSDVALVVTDASEEVNAFDNEIMKKLTEQKIPYLLVRNKADLLENEPGITVEPGSNIIYTSAKNNINIQELKEAIIKLADTEEKQGQLVADLLRPSDFVVLVVPIDKAAPKGRLILPQQQTIRDILEAGAVSVVCRDWELKDMLSQLGKKPALVITDSQVFSKVAQAVPDDIPLTSFSILFARYKGSLETAVQGAAAIGMLEEGDTILVAEGCTHHRQCEDIGTVKLPGWISQYTGKQLNYEFSSGGGYPAELGRYKMIIHCGACMLNDKEMKYRVSCALDAGIPITNYGICIAYMQGILKRSVEPFSEVNSILI